MSLLLIRAGSIRTVRSDEDRIVQHAWVIGGEKWHRLLTTRNSFPPQQPQLDTGGGTKLRPTWTATGVLRKSGPGALHVLAQFDLIRCGAGLRIGTKDRRDLNRVERPCVWEELKVGE